MTRRSQAVGRAPNTSISTTQHVRVNHRRADVLATTQHHASDAQWATD